MFSLLKFALVMGFLVIFLFPLVVRSSDNPWGLPPKIPVVDPAGKIEKVRSFDLWPDRFDGHFFALDDDGQRLFVSQEGHIKILSLVDPVHPVLVGSIPERATGCMAFHEGYLYFHQYDFGSLRLVVYQIHDNHSSIFLFRSEKYSSGEEDIQVRQMFFPREGLLVCYDYRHLYFWDISNKSALQLLSSLNYYDATYFPLQTGAVGGRECMGVAFHPTEAKLLLAQGFQNGGRLYLLDYADPANPQHLSFSRESFIQNNSSLGNTLDDCSDFLVSNGFYPCISGSGVRFEVLDWTNASQPVFCKVMLFPDGFGASLRGTFFSSNSILLYYGFTAVLDFSNRSNICFLTPYYDSFIGANYYYPQVLVFNDFIFAFGTTPHVDLYLYRFVPPASPPPSSSGPPLALFSLFSLLFVPLIGIPLYFRAKSRRQK